LNIRDGIGQRCTFGADAAMDGVMAGDGGRWLPKASRGALPGCPPLTPCPGIGFCVPCAMGAGLETLPFALCMWAGLPNSRLPNCSDERKAFASATAEVDASSRSVPVFGRSAIMQST
jgi:hypothetical protein